jgi:hypothetical protein
MHKDMLIVEDLMLLLLDDETGVPAQAGTLFYTLGGAVLVELALLGAVESDGKESLLSGSRITATGQLPPDDPILRDAYAKVAEKPRRVQTLLPIIGADLHRTVTERLIDRGEIRRDKTKVLGFIPMKTLPSENTGHETELRDRIRAVLVDGATPDARTAAITALLSASGALPMLRPQLAWSSAVYHRAKELEQGNWGAEAVNQAVMRTAAAIAASSAVVVSTTIASSGNS